MSPRPTKLAEPFPLIRELVAKGKFDFVAHAWERLEEREVAIPEVVYVLKYGFHERRKDRFNEDFGEWVYAIRGCTSDRRTLRIAVSISAEGALVITVIDLDK